MVFCLLQSLIMAIPWAVITGLIFELNIAFLYLMTFGYALVLIAENLSLRGGNYQFLTFQRIAVSLVVAIALLIMPNTTCSIWRGWWEFCCSWAPACYVCSTSER
ncbi:Uncharacterised protein [Raoultella planticola]|uniref:Uncharacterized protein n=1 Tax=Raoultella planticola TaxID=575 RepID=A0A485B819_RAOPL|nr:Uncharacterised protein [Raoultella planticola]